MDLCSFLWFGLLVQFITLYTLDVIISHHIKPVKWAFITLKQLDTYGITVVTCAHSKR